MKTFKQILEYILVFDMSAFLVFGICHKLVTKICLVSGMLIYILLKIICERRDFFENFFEKTGLNKQILLFLAVSLISVLLSDNIGHAQETLFQRYIPYFLFFFIAAYLGKNAFFSKILMFSLLAGIFVLSIGGVIDIIHAGTETRLYTSFNKILWFGSYFLFTLPFFLTLALFNSKRRIKILVVLFSLPVVACFFFLYSRGIWISLLASIFIVFGMFAKYRRISLAIILVLVVIFFTVPFFRERLFSQKTMEPQMWGDRVPLWKSAINIFKQHPYFGVGPGNYEMLRKSNIIPSEYIDPSIHSHAHNTYLELLSEIGLFGVLAFLNLVYAYFKALLMKIRDNKDVINIAVMIVFVSMLILECTQTTILVGVFSSSMFWFIMGLPMGNKLIEKSV